MEASNGLRRRRKTPYDSPSESSEAPSLPLLVRSPSRPRAQRFLAAFSSLDVVALVVLGILAAASRFYRLSEPPAVVFDELHFQKFVDRHLSNIWYFDIHPPLGKLILAYFGYVLGYRADPTFIIHRIGDDYPASVNFMALRTVSALFSVATVPMTYLVSRMLLFSRVAAVFTSVQVLTCFLGTIEGRLILMDSQLYFFCQLALFSALCLWRTTPGTRIRWTLLATTGVAAGLALCIKHTALATPGLIAVVSFFGVHFLGEPLTVPECAFAGIISFVTYTLPFYPHLTRVWSTGDRYDKFMKGMPEFQRTLIGSEMHDPAAKRPSFLRMFLFLNYRMLASNANVKKRHNWESNWYQWIVSWRGVLYYSKRGSTPEELTNGVRTIVYLIGNPVIIFLCLSCVTVFVGALFIVLRNRAILKSARNGTLMHSMYTGVFLLSGWACNLAPYILVDRAAFLYHYLPGLFYGQLLTGVMLDLLPGRWRIGSAMVLGTAMCVAYWYWSPWIYAFPLTDADRFKRQWLPRWN